MEVIFIGMQVIERLVQDIEKGIIGTSTLVGETKGRLEELLKEI